MIDKGIETVTAALETVVQKVEQIDISAQDRPAVFGSKQL
jgi:hypothetical protein